MSKEDSLLIIHENLIVNFNTGADISVDTAAAIKASIKGRTIALSVLSNR